jgi:DUF4097 and DUF4098 domain-containing protein YvlB
MRPIRSAIALLATTLACFASPAAPSPCDDLDESSVQMHLGDQDAEETHLDLAPMERPAGRGTLSIRPGENGAVSIRSWDENRVLVCARVHASAPRRDTAEDLAHRVHVEATANDIRAVGPEESARSRWAVSMTVFVPRRTDLAVVTVNGPIRVEGVRGRISLEATNGPIEVKRVGGDVRGRTRNGPIRVRLDGRRWDGAGLDLETVNGPVTIEVPEGYSADLVAGTENGPFTSSWPIRAMGHRRTIRTTLGEGGATIRVTTRNGPARIERL